MEGGTELLGENKISPQVSLQGSLGLPSLSSRSIVFPLHLLPPSIHLHILGLLLSDITNLSAASGANVNVKQRLGRVRVIAKYKTGVLHLLKMVEAWAEFLSVLLKPKTLTKTICFHVKVTSM